MQLPGARPDRRAPRVLSGQLRPHGVPDRHHGVRAQPAGPPQRGRGGETGLGLSLNLFAYQGWESLGTSRFNSDYEVNDSILKQLSMQQFFLCTFPCVIFKIMYASEFDTQSLLISSYFCNDH